MMTRQPFGFAARLAFLFLLSNVGLFASSPPDVGCANNLRQIDMAAQLFALEHNLDQTNSYSLTDTNLAGLFKSRSLPACPEGGIYQPGKTFAEEPTCSLHGTSEQIYAADQRRTQESIRRETARANRWMLA